VYDDGSNIGIGTASPAYKLDVSGTFRTTGIAYLGDATTTLIASIGNSASTGVKIIQFSRASGTGDNVNIQGINTGVGAADFGMQVNGGNVGIGTASPGTKLDVRGIGQFFSGATGSFNFIDVGRIAPEARVAVAASSGDFVAGTAAGDAVFYNPTAANAWFGVAGAGAAVFVTNSAERMRISSTGNIGVGTTNPTARVQISGTTTAFGASEVNLALTGANGVTNSSLLFASENTNFRYQNLFNVSNGVLSWQNSTDGSTYTERMRIDSSGNVGIGTSSIPAGRRLVVSGGSVRMDNDQQIEWGGSTAGLYGNGSTNSLTFFTDTTARVTINSAGNVGIGTASPAAKLDVRGDAIFETSGAGRITLDHSGGVNSVLSTTPGFLDWRQLNIGGSPITFSTGPAGGHSERMRVDTSGNVMIGTTAANNKFLVTYANPVSIPAAGTGGHCTAFGTVGYGLATGAITNGNAYLQATRWDTLALNYDLLLQPNGGNVGIGTTTPGSLLDINGGNMSLSRTNTAGSLTGITVVNAGTTSAYAGINIISGPVTSQLFNDAAGNAVVAGAILRTTTAHPLVFGTNGSERMRITSAGVVGIATTAPAAGQLQIDGTGEIRLTNPANTSGLDIGFWGGVGDASAYIYQRANSSMFFGTNNAARVTITGAGNVGIGTTGPSYPLEVRQDGASSTTYIGALNTTATGSSGAAGYLARAGSNFAYFYVRGDGLAYIDNATANPLVFAVNGTERARIDSSGNLLVGKSVASAVTVGAELRPDGQTYATMASSVSSDSTLNVYSTGAGAYRFFVAMNGQIYATSTSITAISDIRLKENVRELDAGLDTILALKPRRFDWKQGKGKDVRDDMGFIAQEVEEVLPELIGGWKAGEGEPDDLKSVKAGDLIPVLVKAIQELTARVAQLEERK
jgi:hypothetical protein